MKKIYWILANPARHSLSPCMHNRAFEILGIESEYVIFEKEYFHLEGFLKNMKENNIYGLSVSMPYKKEVIKYLDGIDAVAEQLQSVNTVYREGDKFYGTNTDIFGVLDPIKISLWSSPKKNPKIAILGAGGASASAVYALKQISDCIYIYNRTYQKSKDLAERLDVWYDQMDALQISDYDIVVQMTSVGMGEDNISPLKNMDFREWQIVFESIYFPRDTKFIQEARKQWAICITGENMLLFQWIRQFELWTGKKAPLEDMRRSLLEKIQ